LRINPLNF